MKMWQGFVILILMFDLFENVQGDTQSSPDQDPSVPDADDLNLIDDYIKDAEKNKNNDNAENPPSRGSLDRPSTKLPGTSTVAPAELVRQNERGEPCKCIKYYLCNMKQDQVATTTASPNTTTIMVPSSTVIPLIMSTTTTTSTATEAVTETTTEDSGTGGSQNILGVVDIRSTGLRSGLGGNSSSPDKTGNSSGDNGNCPDDVFDVCCPLNDVKEEITTTTTTTTTPPPPPPISTKSPYTPSTSGRHFCGHRNENGVGSKSSSGGSQGESQFGEFPWTVAVIQLEKNDDNFTIHKYIGAGSLLHPQVVLTAAHNVLGKSSATIQVRLGEWDTQTNDEPFPSQDRAVKKVIIHPAYVKQTLYNDLALLILEEEARLSPNVDTICLPPVPKKGKKPINFDEQLCYSTGWGKDNFGVEGRYSEIMKRVTIPVINHDNCQKQLQKSEKLPGFRLDKSFMCAGGGDNGEDTCKGDGGSPLVCSVRGEEDGNVHYVQVGAVAWGLGCKTVYPGVYADVQYLTPWILKTMDKEEMSTEYCTI